MSTDDMDQVDEAADAIEAGKDDVTGTQQRFAYAFVTLVFLGIAGALGAAVWFGYIDVSLTVQATVNVGHLVEWVATAVTLLFLLFLTAMVYMALPGSVLGNGLRAITRIADAYQLPGTGGEDSE